MRKLVVVRPQPGADETARRALDLGIETDVMPLFAVEPVKWEIPALGGFDALLLTSANALRHAGSGLGRLRHMPAYCVGEATASAARQAGLHVAMTGSSDLSALLDQIEGTQSLLHLAGEHRTSAGPTRHRITAVAVYRSAAVDAADMGRRLARSVIAIHSPRAGARLGEIVPQRDRGHIRIAAISEAAADSAGDGWQDKHTAPAPNDTALLVLAASLCEDRDE